MKQVLSIIVYMVLVGKCSQASGSVHNEAVGPCQAAEHSCQYSSKNNKPLGWRFAGPTTYVNRADPRPMDQRLTSAGAAQNIVQSSDGHWFLGSVNGGVWRTSNLSDKKPYWSPVLDGQPVTCTSIAAMYASPTSQRIYAGCGGSTSSEQGADWNVVNSGDWSGVMVSSDNGDTWKMLKGFPPNYYVTSILETPGGVLLVAAQSHLFDRNNGGIWRSVDIGETFDRVDPTPTFNLYYHKTLGIVATHARNATHVISMSTNHGLSFQNMAPNLPWKDPNAIPFYTCATILEEGINSKIILAAMIRLPGGFSNNTDSQFFVGRQNGWNSQPFPQPMSMDEDGMPKDRMALLADPQLRDLIYVAGNAGALVWRVNVTSKQWTKMWDKPDVSDGSVPHGDCRNFAWDDAQQRLLLVSDGGLFAREQPRTKHGKWISLNGNYASLELLSAKYDPVGQRYVAGAQDNCAIVTKMNAFSGDVGIGFVEGDGAITIVDSNGPDHSRLYGTTQFLGVGTIYSDPTMKVIERKNDDDDDDNECGGLCFVQGDMFIEVPLSKYFPEPSSFPYFVHPYTLNYQDHTLLHFWTNGTSTRPSAFYEFSIPYSVQSKDDIGPPSILIQTPPDAMILEFVSGGYTAGKPDPTLLVAISHSHLYVLSNLEAKMVERPLPVPFAEPVTLDYDMTNNGARILGPLTHAKTISMSVLGSDSRVVAVTGWQSIDDNNADEAIYLTSDAGKTWTDITGDLRTASGVVGKVRPGGLQFVELENRVALLVGTSSGVLVTYISVSATVILQKFKWVRLGTCDEFPIVLCADVDYETSSDKLIIATFGRGIYVLDDAKEKLQGLQDCSVEAVKTQ